MEGIFLVLVVLGISVQGIAQKAYNRRVAGGVFSFTAASAFFAGIVHLLVSGGKLDFSGDFLIYSIVFALSYCAASLFMLLAIGCGSLSLTSLLMQYSLLIPTAYGLLMLDEPVKFWLFVGIAMLMVSLVLINQEGKVEKKQITLRWGVCVLLMFLGNGICATTQKIQQVHFNGQYKSEFMVVAMAISVVVLLVMAVITEKKEVLPHLKKGIGTYTVCGLANGVSNFLVLTLAVTVPASVMYPIIASGGVVATALVARFVYKETLSRPQKIGFVLGVLAIIALNL